MGALPPVPRVPQRPSLAPSPPKRWGLLQQGQRRPPQPPAEERFVLPHVWQSPVGLLASEMAYFSTVFKTELIVTARARVADKDQHFFIWCSGLSQTRSCQALRPRHPQSGAWRLLVPALGTIVGRAGGAVGAEAGTPVGRAAGRSVVWCGEWMAGEPSKTLTFAATWGAGHT